MVDDPLIEIGSIVGLHGLAGWVKVRSWADPPQQLLSYRPLYIDGSVVEEFEGKPHGSNLLLRLDGYDDRTAVEPLVGKSVAVKRSQLPEPQPGEYYHVDLKGLAVVTTGGVKLGTVEDVMSTGANDVLVVRGDRERLIPFTVGHAVVEVDLGDGRIVVDWDVDWP